MAASYVTAGRTFLNGVHLVPGRRLFSQSRQTATACQCWQFHAARCRPLHVSAAASLEPQRGTHTGHRRAEEQADYIPKKKAKNPMMAVGYAWMIGLPTSIIGFLLAKREVEKNRLKQLKVRQRMKRSNEGEFEGSRYHHHHKEEVKLDSNVHV